MIQVALDIGGTFTDLALRDMHSGKLYFWKVPSTPSDLSIAVLSGLDELLKRVDVAPEQVGTILHATTVATNAIIEHKGSRTALLTTRGFRDVIIIGRQKRHETYDLYLDKPKPLVLRRDVLEVGERVSHTGEVLVNLDRESVEQAVDNVIAGGYASVAISFLHSYANSAHEKAVQNELSARVPDVAVSLSSEISPKMREYERTSTTVANAYIKPIFSRYLSNLQDSLKDRAYQSDLFIMQSNGGLVSPEIARDYPIRIVESGPAAGVLMCNMIGRQEGRGHILTFDMGGTTAKLGAIDNGEPAIVTSFETNMLNFRKNSGLPLNITAIELIEMGAGGGSIAEENLGLIKVGPESAGAEPGPICYMQGGTKPTITDADLVLGFLNPDYFNGGAFHLDVDAASAGIERHLARPLGLPVEKAAWGIHTVANSNMEGAMRIVSVERGRDPRKYAMVAFGGAGPVHAARLAHAIGVPQVIIPFGAGVGSAYGLLEADSKIDVSLTRFMSLTMDASGAINEVYRQLENRAKEDLKHLRLAGKPKWSRHANMRYAGQGYELRVELPGGVINEDYARQAISEFQKCYKQNYGYQDPEGTIEAIDWYLMATVPRGVHTHHHQGPDRHGKAGESMTKGTRQAYFPEAGGYIPCRIVDRYRMEEGAAVEGPAIIEEREATTLILPGDIATVSPSSNLLITIKHGA